MEAQTLWCCHGSWLGVAGAARNKARFGPQSRSACVQSSGVCLCAFFSGPPVCYLHRSACVQSSGVCLCAFFSGLPVCNLHRSACACAFLSGLPWSACVRAFFSGLPVCILQWSTFVRSSVVCLCAFFSGQPVCILQWSTFVHSSVVCLCAIFSGLPVYILQCSFKSCCLYAHKGTKRAPINRHVLAH
eukprot:1147367-Pelagomonas_calceolata.AAC.5